MAYIIYVKAKKSRCTFFSFCGFYQNDDGKINVVHFRIFRVNDFWAPFCCFNGRVTINLGGEGWVSVFFLGKTSLGGTIIGNCSRWLWAHKQSIISPPTRTHSSHCSVLYNTFRALFIIYCSTEKFIRGRQYGVALWTQCYFFSTCFLLVLF